jgi:hypothetical protein
MSFWRRTHEEKAAAAALKAEKERLYVAKMLAKAAKTKAATAKAAYRQSRYSGKQGIIEARARRTSVRLQRAEEREEARYVTATDRLERDRLRGLAKQVRVRGSSRARRHRRSRPRR